jgi:hypothetical protein
LKAPPAGRLSDSIAIARVLCILGIVYVHAWTGRPDWWLVQTIETGQGVFRWILMEAFGRSAVPLLSIVSGWLLAGSSRLSPYGPFLAGKAKTILLPMILWNALSMVLVSGAAGFGLIQAPVPHDLWWLVDELFCLVTMNDINVQTAFLRDLFVCMALAPLALRLPRLWFLGLLGAVTAWAVSGWDFALILRPQIPLFFLLGIVVRRAGLAERLATLPFALALGPALLLVSLKIWLSVWGHGLLSVQSPTFVALDIATRLAVSLAMWRVTWALAASPAPFRRIEPYAFLMFCTHLILIWLATPLLYAFPGPLGSPAYPVLLVLQPALAMGLTILIGRGLLRLSPPVAAILSGGRLKPNGGHRTLPPSSATPSVNAVGAG